MATKNYSEIAEGVYWVGDKNQEGGLHCNPYLIVDGDEAVLIDPGSVLDFEQVYKNIESIIPLEKLKYVVLDHQDPDLCASVPLFEKAGCKFEVVTHWRTQTLVIYYGITSEYYIVNEHDYKLTLKSGREIQFIPTPYLHFAGSIVTYDTLSKVLFSSDLFGAFSDNWTLYAGEDYIEKMEIFHEHYMPSNDMLNPIMRIFLSMDISLIAPQHGSIIKEDTKKYMRILRDLECGSFLNPIKQDLAELGGYLYICSTVLKRYAAVFGKNEVLSAVKDLDIKVDIETMEMTDYNYTGDVLWNTLFEHILKNKGNSWILLVEPLIQRFTEEFGVRKPTVFVEAEKKGVFHNKETIKRQKVNSKMDVMLGEARERLIKDPITKLYNYDFFKNYLSEAITQNISGFNPALLVIKLDNIENIRFSYGEEESNRLLINTTTILKSIKEDNAVLFRLQGSEIACYFLDSTKEAATDFAEKVRYTIASSNAFIERTTVSIGVSCLDEITDRSSSSEDLFDQMSEIALYRLSLAENAGKDTVCNESEIIGFKEKEGKVLIVDTDEINIDVISTLLENSKIKVLTAKDGETALSIAEREAPDVIISEIMLPKKDAFRLKENLLMRSRTKNINVVLISHLKNEDSMERALSLGITHYLKKPFMLSELIGIVKLLIKGEVNG